ncbi:hypothetical protein [Maribacter sp. 2304DJ31-5]|uniref:hypothetical protein n=1 Tax=Maribacter sp. 2304DJ31-5 TaxID=3386273 RepID=UPI0039BD315D
MKVFVIDDNIPKITEFVENNKYDSSIDTIDLSYLVRNAEWKGEQNLQRLLKYLLNHAVSQKKEISIEGFTHPEICLSHIDSGILPDIIIYDWEYGSEHDNNSSNWLMEIIELTKAFIFVYSGVKQFIPAHLNKESFDQYADRFQLFGKGNNKNSLFSSEEFILNLIVGRVRSDNEIMMQGIPIQFNTSGYLEEVSDIQYLEKMFDRGVIIQKLKNGINESSIEQLLSESNEKIFWNPEKGYLMTNESEIITKKFEPTVALSFLEVAKKFGLESLTNTLSRSLIKI